MQYRVSRNDQEFGPYTLEELQRYASEGSILPNDYVFNGVEWLLVSQFLEDPHKGMATSQSISSIANLAPQNNFSNEHINAGDSSGKSKLNLKSIVGAIIVIAIVAYNFFNNQNATKAEQFYNRLNVVTKEYIKQIDDNTSEDEELSGDWTKQVLLSGKKLRENIEDISIHPGKNGVGYMLKDNSIELSKAYDTFVKKNLELKDKFEKDALKNKDQKDLEKLSVDLDLEMEKIGEAFFNEIEKIFSRREKLQNQYAKNNNLELID